ncbi:MAG: thiamine-phosphate kinase [Gemmatimonadaceae bacterium]
MSEAVRLGMGSEFDIVRAMLERWGEVASGIGDDAAILAAPKTGQLVVSTDTSVENVHFRRAWLTPREIGYRAAAAALSDLAAMAARPLGLLLALSFPPDWLRDILEVASGIGEAVQFGGTRIIGGDLSEAAELVVGATVLGSANHPLSRSGAHPDDIIYVTGTFGGPLAALESWNAGREPVAECRARFAHPVPRLAEARWLAHHGASACIDVSDGIAGDLDHMAHASGVRINIDASLVPRLAASTVMDALRSGEEYELAVAAPTGMDTSSFEREFGIPLTAVGRVKSGEPGVDVYADGERVADLKGYSHF